MTAVSACSSAPRRAGAGPGTAGGPSGGGYGPPAPQTAQPYGPEQASARPIVLVLGPGLARGYAHAGVLRALHDAKVPIAAILGTEMGGLIGAAYAMTGSISRLEWSMQRFREDVFSNQSGLISRLSSEDPKDGEKLEKALSRVFDEKDISTARIPVRIVAQPQAGGDAVVLEHGPVAQALRAAMADPDLFNPGQWNGQPFVSAKWTKPFAVIEARTLGLGPVLAVDVMDPKDAAGAQAKAYGECNDADLIIRPELSGIGPLDFDKRAEAIFRGKTAVVSQLAKIRQLAGMPDPSPTNGGGSAP